MEWIKYPQFSAEDIERHNEEWPGVKYTDSYRQYANKWLDSLVKYGILSPFVGEVEVPKMVNYVISDDFYINNNFPHKNDWMLAIYIGVSGSILCKIVSIKDVDFLRNMTVIRTNVRADMSLSSRNLNRKWNSDIRVKSFPIMFDSIGKISDMNNRMCVGLFLIDPNQANNYEHWDQVVADQKMKRQQGVLSFYNPHTGSQSVHFRNLPNDIIRNEIGSFLGGRKTRRKSRRKHRKRSGIRRRF